MGFWNQPSPLEPSDETEQAIADGCPVAATYYVSKFAEGDDTVSIYWQQRAQAVLLLSLMEDS